MIFDQLKKVISIIMLWRDAEEYIQRSLTQIEGIERELSSEYDLSYSFYENDSVDHTANLLKQWIKGRDVFFMSERSRRKKMGSIQSTKRTKFLAEYRNKCLKSLLLKNSDYLLVLDSDVIYESTFIKQMISSLNDDSKLGMITANTTQNVADAFNSGEESSYYDSWALIDKDKKPGLTFASNPFLSSEDRKKWSQGQRVYVQSAFGGAALIRGELKNQIIWNGDRGCEHWYLCKKIREANYLIAVDPTIQARVIHNKEVSKPYISIVYDWTRLKLSEFRERNARINFQLITIFSLNIILKMLLKLKRISIIMLRRIFTKL